MKLYKNITFGLLALTLGGVVASCSDFLDEKLTTQQISLIHRKVLISWLWAFTITCVSISSRRMPILPLITVRMSLLWVVMVPIKCGIIMMVVSSHRL